MDAMTMIKRRRPQIDPIPAFMKILSDYEAKCIQLGYIIVPPKPSNSIKPNDNATILIKEDAASFENDDHHNDNSGMMDSTATTVSKQQGQQEQQEVKDDHQHYVNINKKRSPLPIIGPTLPPREKDEVDDMNQRRRSPSTMIGPTLPPTNTSIGLTLPSTQDDTATVTTTATATKKHRIVGPTLPPPQPQQQQQSQHLPKPTSSLIGPTLPPPHDTNIVVIKQQHGAPVGPALPPQLQQHADHNNRSHPQPQQPKAAFTIGPTLPPPGNQPN